MAKWLTRSAATRVLRGFESHSSLKPRFLNKMKKIYLIHGWGGSSRGGWFDWLREELEERGINVYAFDMPETNSPNISKWVSFLETNIKELDENVYFVGHSVGCQAIMRFLEKLPENIKIKGCVFVGGWFNLKEGASEDEEDRETARPWVETPINFEKAKNHCDNFLAIFSDNDPYVPLSDKEIFKEKLNAEIIIKNNHEHFKEVEQIEEILEFILK